MLKIRFAPGRYSPKKIVPFAIIFALFGSFALYKSFASPTITVTGTYLAYHVDGIEKGPIKEKDRIDETLTTDQGRQYILKGTHKKIHPDKKQRLTVTGTLTKSNEITIGQLGTGPGQTNPVAETIKPPVGNHKMAIIMASFRDRTVPGTASNTNTLVFSAPGGAGTYVSQGSGGKASLSGAAFGPYTLDYSVANCDGANSAYGTNYSAWENNAIAKALAAGVDLSSYDVITVVWPDVNDYYKNGDYKNQRCTWSGRGSFGLNPQNGKSYIYLNGSVDSRVLGHEYGHTLGLNHAAGWYCKDSAGTPIQIGTDSQCSVVGSVGEYADGYDGMGNGGIAVAPTFTLPHRLELGWAASGQVQNVSAFNPGTYTITAETVNANASPTGLRIPRGTTGEYYYVDYKTSGGYFDNFATGYDPKGALIHLSPNLAGGATDYKPDTIVAGGAWTTSQSRLIDTNPGSSIDKSWPNPFVDASLKPGQTFTDPQYGITVSTVSADANALTVKVSFASSSSSSSGTSGTTASLVNAPTQGGWTAWNYQGGQTETTPAAVSWGPGRIDLLAMGTDSATWHKYWDSTANTWSGWGSLGGTTANGPGVSSWGPGRLDVFVRGTNNGVYQKTYTSAGGWSGWGAIGNFSTNLKPAAVSWGAGRIDVFAIGLDNAVWHNWYARGWHTWESLGGATTSGASVASWGDGHLDVFVRGTDGAIWHKWYVNGAWSNWASLGGPTSGTAAASPPAVVASGYGHIFLFARGNDDHVYTKNFDANAGWQSGWTYIGGTTTNGPAVASWAQGRLDLFITNNDGHVYNTAIQLNLPAYTPPPPPPPDSDNDGIIDANDGCPTQAGPSTNGGCPVHIIGLYHYYNPSNYDSFYTTSRNDGGYAYYGYGFADCNMGVMDGQNPGSVPLWRYWNSTGGDHFYTINRNDAGYAAYGYGIENQEGWVYPPNTSSSLYNMARYFAGGWIVDHFYNKESYGTSPAWSYPNYSFEGVEAQVFGYNQGC